MTMPFVTNGLGRIGTFVRINHPKSTLCASPHLDISCIQSYDDFSAEFEITFQQAKVAQATSTQEILKTIGRKTAMNLKEFTTLRRSILWVGSRRPAAATAAAKLCQEQVNK